MKIDRSLATATLGAVLILCGCTSYKDIMEQYMRQQAEMVAAAKAKPLPPLPDYPDDAKSAYDTSARLVVVGQGDESAVIRTALKEAGCNVLAGSVAQTAVFQRPDLVLSPSCTYNVVHGDGSSWLQVRLVICIRRAIRLAVNGSVEQVPEPRIFQMYARVPIPDNAAAYHVPDGSVTSLGQLAVERAKGEARGQEALKQAVARLMRIDAFRRAISEMK